MNIKSMLNIRISHWLAAVACVAVSHATWAQDAPATDAGAVQLEIADRYGDTHTIPLREGSTLYWPQGRPQGLPESTAFGVLTDKDGVPYHSFRFDESNLGYIRFLNAPASTATPELPALGGDRIDPNNERPFPARFEISGESYLMNGVGELRFSSPLGTYELVTPDGRSFTIPMAATEFIHYRDTVQGIGGYLGRFADEARVYYWAFWDGNIPSIARLGEDLYAMVPDDSNCHYTLFMPTDEAFQHVPAIVSYASQKPQVWQLTWNANSSYPLSTGRVCYAYDFQTGERAESYMVTEELTQEQVNNYMAMMLRSHVILHNRPEDREGGLNSGNEYYLALDGSPIRVIREDGKVIGVQSTFHLWNEQHGRTAMTGGSTASLVRANITRERTKNNGTVYQIDNTLEATPCSVVQVLRGDELADDEENPFSAFYDLCFDSGVLIDSYGLSNLCLNYVGSVPFTLYVPTNEAIEAEKAAGRLATTEDIQRFVRAHIQYGIEVADKLPFEREHTTALIKPSTMTPPRLTVKGLGSGKMTVTDECGNTRNILDANKNMFVREVTCYRSNWPHSPMYLYSMSNVIIQSYATGVIHQIDGVLRYNP